ncbi:MAG: methyltransferase domain-containing protein [Rhodospirillales bacterium]|nr:methyltransferase domain-containing protein [Rhodospirillales bacterium]
MQSEQITSCRICGGAKLDVLRDLGVHALSGRFPGPDEEDAPRAPMCVVMCAGCGLVQLAHNYPHDELYGHAYGYRSGINQTMTRHLAAISQDMSKRANLKAGDLALDIGSNDGTLLSSYAVPGLKRLGIDPTIAQYRSYYPPDIQAVPSYFERETFHAATGDEKAKVITSIAMFYDLENPNKFVADIAKCLDAQGIWSFEQSHLGLMIERNAFDTICHEHLEYYSLRQIESLLASHGLRVFDVELNDVNGGSFRLYACHQGAAHPTVQEVEKLRARELQSGLDQMATYSDFFSRMDQIAGELAAFLRREKAAGRTICVYGASTKGNTLLQLAGIDHTIITAAADRNPSKWGRRTPATGIPIISEEQARQQRPDYFLVLPWHFKSEFLARESEYLAQGGKLIFPLPEFAVYSAKDIPSMDANTTLAY